MIGAANHHCHRRQQSSQRPDGGGLPGAAIAEDQDPADCRIDGRHQQGKLHVFLSSDRCEWIGSAHRL